MANKCENSMLHVMLNMPLTCAVWYDFSDFVYVSNGMRKMLNVNNNSVNIYDFSRLFKNVFGGFLDDASNVVKMRGTYSSTHYLHALTLKYDTRNNLYILYVTDIEKKESEILDNLPIYVWKRDNNLKLVYCNKKYASALDMNAEQAIEKNACLPVTASPHGLSVAQLALATSQVQTKRQAVVIKGSRQMLEIKEFPFNNRFLQFGYAIDVTKEEECKAELEAYKKQTEDTFNNISVAMVVFGADTKLLFINQAMKKMFDLDDAFISQDLTCSKLIDWLIHEDKIIDLNDNDELKNRILSYFVDIVEPQHHIVHTPSGKSISMLVSPNLSGGLVFVMEDISDKMDIERKYNSVIATQKETFEHLQEGIMIFSQDNRIRILNKSVCEMFSLSECNQFIGMHIKEFFTKCTDVLEGEYTSDILISKLITASLQRTEQSTMLHMKNGKHINVSYVPLPDGSNLVTMVDTSIDVAYNEAKEQTDELKQKIIQMKYNFVQNATCELTTPIKAIMDFIEVLQEQYFGELNTKQLAYCKNATTTAEKLLSLIDTLLWLGKISHQDVQLRYDYIEIKDVINNCLKDFEKLITEKNIHINVDIDMDDEQLYCDLELLTLVIKTILRRAFSETKQNQTISVSVMRANDASDCIDVNVKWIGRGIKNQQINAVRSAFTENNMLRINTLEEMDLMLICRAMFAVKGHVLVGMCDEFTTEIVCKFYSN